jgi:preprotein translocase subunit SecA
MALSAVHNFFSSMGLWLYSHASLPYTMSTVFSKAIGRQSKTPLIEKLTQFQLADAMRIQKIVILLTDSPEGEDALIDWMIAAGNSLGDEVFTLISNPASYEGKVLLQETVCLLQQLVEMGQDCEKVLSLLTKFYHKQLTVPALLTQIVSAKEIIESRQYSEKDIGERLQEFSILPDELSQITDEYRKICCLGQRLRYQEIQTWIDQIKGSPDKLMILAVAREAIGLKFGIYPYNTQMLTILVLLNHPKACKGRIAQVKTGEGKSIIIAMLAFYHAALGHTVDIVSSSRYLARRDQEKDDDLLQTFGFTTSHICSNEPSKEDFQKQVIFGTHYDFEFSILRDYLHMNQMRVGLRPFHIVIVDEVDNLFVDSSLHSARLAIRGRVSFEWIYQPILNFVKEQQERISISEMTEKLSWYLKSFSSQTSPISQEKLEVWLQMAYAALYEYKLNEDYVIKVVEGKTQIVIVDKRNTGRLQEKSRWQNGIHEFLEAKHGLPITEESITSCSLCHSVFFNQYETIYGLTGTIGTDIEQKEIEAIYNIDTVIVPPHKPNCRLSLDPITCHNQEAHFAALLSEVRYIQSQQRPILILFESIHDTKDFGSFLKRKGIEAQLLNERQGENEEFVIARAGAPEVVTIATNTAGRGTDIILHPTTLEFGGLHVVFAFYPQNQRVEDQGFGRAARQGQPGSHRMILLSPFPLIVLKHCRDENTTRLSQHRLERSHIEAIKHKYLQHFFNHLQAWQHALDDTFLSMVVLSAEQLNILVAKRHIHDATLLNSFLKEMRSQLYTQLLQDWAEHFYDPLDDLYTSLKKTYSDPQLFEEKYKHAIGELYQRSKAHWEGSLLSPEAALSRQAFPE